jgi:hypothetical protein
VLFDLQSPGRRRVVRVVFGALAAIFAISFVFLGVGTGGGGFSLSDLLGTGGGGSSSNAFSDQINAQEKLVAANPANTSARASLVRLHYSAAVQNVNSDGTFTSDGQQQLNETVDSWNKYVRASNGKPDPGTAAVAVQAFDALGVVSFQEARSATSTADALQSINTAVASWKGAADAQQVLVNERPTSPSYVKLAYYRYLSGDIAAGDAAAAQAKKTAKGSEASQIDQQLTPIKQLGTQLQSAIKQLNKQQQAAQGAAGGAATGGATGGGNPLGGIGSGLSGTGLSGGQ